MKSISESIIGRKGVDHKYQKIPGKIKWRLINRTAYSIDVEEVSDSWYAMYNDDILLFWAPGVEWCPCFDKNEKLKNGKIFWFLIENDLELKNKKKAYDTIMIDTGKYVLDHHYIDFLDEIEFPDDILRKVIAHIIYK